MKLRREENYFRNRGSTNYNNPCPHTMGTAKSLEGKLLPSVKIKDLSYNEADTEISIHNLISVLNCDLTWPGHSL